MYLQNYEREEVELDCFNDPRTICENKTTSNISAFAVLETNDQPKRD